MSPVPADLACFAVHAASRALDGAYRHELREFGLTYPQYLALLVLWDREPQSVKELGMALRFDSGTLSPLLKRLEAAGLVVRERNAADERSVLVGLTAKGRSLRQRAEGLADRVFEALDFDLEEAHHLRDTLRRLTAELDALSASRH